MSTWKEFESSIPEDDTPVRDKPSKTLIVYAAESHYKYYDLFIEHIYEVNAMGHLIIYKHDGVTGEDAECAYFKKWDYFLIET